MPIQFYNTAPPTPTTKNTINSITLDYGIRDFLLHKNLNGNSGSGGFYPFLGTSPAGGPRIGEPVTDTSINNNANVVPIGLPLEVWGLTRYQTAVAVNQFQNNDQDAPSLLSIDYVLPIQNPQFGSVDFPIGSEYPTTATDQITQLGLLGKTNYAGFRKENTLYNLYLDLDNEFDAGDLITLKPKGISKQLPGYLKTFGAVNDGILGPLEASDVLGDSLLNASVGAGLSLSVGGASIGFDFQASLATRNISASSTVKDTNLGFIASQELGRLLSNNATFNSFSDYSITVPTQNFVSSLLNSILGYDVPKSYLTDGASIFSSENQSGNIQRANSMLLNTGSGQFNALIENMTANLQGTGQYDNPMNTLFRTGYSPGYTDSKGQLGINPLLYAFYDDATKGTIYNFMNNPNNSAIPEISYNRDEMIKKYGFLAPEDTYSGPVGNAGYDNRKISDVGFTWTTSNSGAVNASNDYDELPDTFNINGLSVDLSKSLLTKTQKLFNSKGMLNIVSVKGDMNKNSSQIQTANGGGFSKGSAVIQGNRYVNGVFDGQKDTADNTYCRSWTTLDRYEYANQLIRHSSLKDTADKIKSGTQEGYRYQYDNSTLEDGGFVKIAPYIDDKYSDFRDPDLPVNGSYLLKNYMFSIENLAWNENLQNLPPVEVGPGDKLNNIKGRIMWFPPYNIKFTETSSVQWESTNFIGRGEPVYTYNNTERSGNLSFSVIVDHPSYANSFRGPNGPDNNYVASFFAGCLDIDSEFAKRLTVSEISAGSQETQKVVQKATITPETPPEDVTVYFPNDVYTLNLIQSGYENGLDKNLNPITSVDGQGFGIGSYLGEITPQQPITGYTDNYNFGLNAKDYKLNGKVYSGFNDTNYWTDLKTYLTVTCPSCTVEVSGYASSQGDVQHNTQLANNRAVRILDYIKTTVFNNDATRLKTAKTEILNSSGCIVQKNAPTDTQACKQDRKATIHFVSDPSLIQPKVAPAQPVSNTNAGTQQISSKIINKFYNEASYFQRLTSYDKFIFDDFRSKIKYFHPAFHSMTPEGLNSRLTFLQQCTRQGPTNESQDAANLAFGRPPVCILRIGDFYHTKIVIDNLSIDYEPLVWDLNPEGVGVQPMIANVNISFKFIGASSLYGPINKLQNALSFNYYANTHVYDFRADYIAKSTSKTTTTTITNSPDKKNSEVITPTITAVAGGYMLVEGATSLADFTTTTISNINTNQPVQNTINQTAASTQAQALSTPPAVAPSDDYSILVNAILTGKYLLSINYSNGTYLSGVFGITSGGLSKDYDAKVVLSNPLGGNVDIAAFKVYSNNADKPNSGTYTSTKDGWKDALSAMNTNTFQYYVYFPTLQNVKAYGSFSILPYDCPDEDVNAYDIISPERYDSINKNPCHNCYPNGTNGQTITINGTSCSKTSN